MCADEAHSLRSRPAGTPTHYRIVRVHDAAPQFAVVRRRYRNTIVSAIGQPHPVPFRMIGHLRVADLGQRPPPGTQSTSLAPLSLSRRASTNRWSDRRLMYL